MTPVLGICGEFKNHITHYVGNLPEKQPMDNTLNKDQHESVDRHVVLSQALSGDKGDGSIFSH